MNLPPKILDGDIFPFPGAWGADGLLFTLARNLLWIAGVFLLLWLLDWASERARSRRRPEAARSALVPLLVFLLLACGAAFGLLVLWRDLPVCRLLAQGEEGLFGPPHVRPFARAMLQWKAVGALGALVLLATAYPVWRRRAAPPAGGAWKAWVPRVFWLLFLAALLRGLAPLPAVWRLAEISAGGACGTARSEPSNLRTFEPSNAAPFDLAAATAAARSDGAEILVPPGVYPPISTGGKRLVIRAIEGPEKTVIDASLLWPQGITNRCATLAPEREARRLSAAVERVKPFHAIPEILVPRMGEEAELAAAARRWPPESPMEGSSRLVGFTLRKGRADLGGGAFGGALEDCRFDSCFASFAGGGAFGAILEGCAFAGNAAGWMGGGAFGGRSAGCRYEGNYAEYGGGAWGGVHAAPVFRGNGAEVGGACAAARLREPSFEDNRALRLAPDSFGGTR